jgi:hypothetical protein
MTVDEYPPVIDRLVTQSSLSPLLALSFAISLTAGVIPLGTFTFGSIVGVTLYNVLGGLLVVVFGVVLLLIPRFTFDRYSSEFLVLNVVLLSLVVLLPVVAGRSIPPIRVFAHVLAIGFAVAFAITSRSVRRWQLYLYFVIGVVPILLIDLGAFLGLLPAYRATAVIPFFSYGGIGVKTSMGSHGIAIGIGFFSMIGLYPSTTNDRYRLILLVLITLTGFLALASQSRSTLIGFLMGLIAIVGYSARRGDGFFDRVARIGLPIGTVAGGAIVGWLAALRMNTVTGRLRQTELALELTREFPLGIGWNTYYGTYSEKVLHNTPLNYFLSGGLALGLSYLAIFFFPVIVVLRLLRDRFARPRWDVHVFLAMYAVIVAELLLFKSTPNVHLLAITFLLCDAASRPDSGDQIHSN